MKRFLTILFCAMLIVMGNALYLKAGDITSTGMSQKDLVQFLTNTVSLVNELKTDAGTNKTLSDEVKSDFNLARGQLLNRSCNSGAIAVSGERINVATAFDYVIGGVFYSKAIASNTALTANSLQSATTYRLYLLSINSSGTITCTAGTQAATDTAVLPELPASSAPFGYFKVQTGPGKTFTSGTTTLVTSTDHTVTLYNISMMTSGSSASTAVSNSSSETTSASDLSLTGL